MLRLVAIAESVGGHYLFTLTYIFKNKKMTQVDTGEGHGVICLLYQCKRKCRRYESLGLVGIRDCFDYLTPNY